MIQVPKNNEFRKTRSRLGQENPKKEVEPIGPKPEAESQTKYIIYRSIITGKKLNLKRNAYNLSHTCCLKKNQNAPRPSEHPSVRGEKMSKRLGGIKGCKYKTSS